MQAAETPLFDVGDFDSKRWLDFHKIPENVWPTGLSVLEQRGDYLLYRVADSARKISPKQNSIFRALAGLSNFPDSPCNITVLVVTGIPESTQRTWAIYDHMNYLDSKIELQLTTTEAIQQFIQNWFNDRQRGR